MSAYQELRQPETQHPVSTSGGYRRHRWTAKTIAQSFDPRKNSLNFLRLLFALLVVFSHAITLGAFGGEQIAGHLTLGDIAVDGFFGLSGFLITRSAANASSIRRFLWHRFLRIYPGMWVCLLVVAFAIALLGWIHQNPGVPVSQYFRSSTGPFQYLAGNFTSTPLLAINPQLIVIPPVSAIAGTPAGVPFSGTWSGQLWTIQWELLCYVLLALFAKSGLLRRRSIVLGFAVGVWSLAWIFHFAPAALPNAVDYWLQPLRLVPDFMAGALLYLYSDKIRDSWILLIVSAAIFGYGLTFQNPLNLDTLSGPALAYVALWLGVHLPFRQFGRRNDLSYGVYIYAFPVEELLAVWHVYRWGYWPYALLTASVALGLATTSWKLVESRAMRLKDWSPFAARLRSVDDQGEVEVVELVGVSSE